MRTVRALGPRCVSGSRCVDDTLVKVAIGLVSAVVSILGTLAAKERSAGRDAERLANLTKDVGALAERLSALSEDVDHIGQIARDSRTLLGVASETGEVPKYVPRDSGEGRALR